MFETILEILLTIISFLLLPFILIVSGISRWFINPFIENVREDGIIMAILTAVICTLPIILFVRWRIKLNRRKKYWRERVYQDEPLTPNEIEQMRVETRDGLADFLSNLYIGPY